ncbi:MAG: hypothetical protein ABEN55_13450 [Bradymonadaceae bacterium]
MSDLTEEQIRNADPEQLSDWIAQVKDDPVKSEVPGGGVYVPEYASEWWAAGPLLEELQGIWLTEEVQRDLCDIHGRKELPETDSGWGVMRYDLDEEWLCGPAHSFHGYTLDVGRGDTAPEAVARAWLLAYERGLLEVSDA